jgi:tRNA-2-methylthio-N6-dimethylallyladenosine synthase
MFNKPSFDADGVNEMDGLNHNIGDEPLAANTGEPPEKRTVFIKSYGCQMNVYDSQKMMALLTENGWSAATTPEEADFVLLNTCHIREKAAEKVYSELGRLRRLAGQRKMRGKSLTIGVAGCVAQAEGEEIQRRQPAVDLVVGPQTYHRLPSLLRRVQNGEKVVDTAFPAEDKFDHLPSRPKMGAPTAFLTVQEGCDKFCSFCVVPYTRGAEVSRPAGRILAEAQKLVARGVKEITLLGQNVNAYHGTGDGAAWRLSDLLSALSKIDGLHRLRYTTSHPNDMTDDLIEAHAALTKLMPYLHLPVQAGSDTVLKAMNRKHTAESYLRVIERVRAARPDIALSGDFIVGFPGETDADFEKTLALVRDVGYAQAFSFKYSPRPGTPAASQSQVAEEVKSERLEQLQTLLLQQQAVFMQNMVGKRVSLLLEKPGRKPGQLVGRTPHLQRAHICADGTKIGDFVDVTIQSAGRNSLEAVMGSAAVS